MIPCRRSLEFMKIESWVVEQFGSSPRVENGLARPSCRLFSPAIFSIENDKGDGEREGVGKTVDVSRMVSSRHPCGRPEVYYENTAVLSFSPFNSYSIPLAGGYC